MNENCFPKLGKIGPKQFQNPGLSLRGKNRTQNRSPNEEKNKNTNGHIGALAKTKPKPKPKLFRAQKMMK